MKRIFICAIALVGGVEGATVVSELTQRFSGNTSITVYYTNNDNAIFSTATVDFNTTYGAVLDGISANNPDYLGMSRSEIAEDVGMTIRGAPTGEVDFGWVESYDSNTGLVTLTNNGILADATYDRWYSTQSNSIQDMMAITFNFGNKLDFNGNGSIDANETLIASGTVTNGFIGYQGGVGAPGDTQTYQFQSIPEPSSALMLLAGASLFLRRRR